MRQRFSSLLQGLFFRPRARHTQSDLPATPRPKATPPSLEDVRQAYQRGDYPTVLEIGEQLEAAGEKSYVFFRLLGFSCLRTGDSGRARTYFERALFLEPDEVRGLEALFQTCKAAGDIDATTSYARRIADICRAGPYGAAPIEFQRWVYAEAFLGQQGRLGQALRKALAAFPDVEPFASRWSELLLRLAESEMSFDPELEVRILARLQAPDADPGLALDLFRVYVRNKHFGAAKALHEDWKLRFSPKQVLRLRSLCHTPLAQGHVTAAEIVLQLYRAHAPVLLDTLAGYATWIKALELTDQPDELRRALEQAVAAYPGESRFAQHLIARLLGSGDLELALAAARRLLEIAPSAERVVPRLVEGLLEQGRSDLARDFAASLLGSMSASAWLCWLARLFRVAGEQAAAAACYGRLASVCRDACDRSGATPLESAKDFQRWIEAEHFLEKHHHGDPLKAAAAGLAAFPEPHGLTGRFVAEFLRHDAFDEDIECLAAQVRSAGLGDQGFYQALVHALLERGRVEEAVACSCEWSATPAFHPVPATPDARPATPKKTDIVTWAERDCRKFSEIQPQVYASVRRHLDDQPVTNSKPYKLGLFGRRRTTHFMDPVLAALKNEVEVYRYYHFSEDLLAQLAGLDAFWVEWGVFAFVLQKLEGAERGACKVFVRVIDWEAGHEELVSNTPWAAADGLVFISTAVQQRFLDQRPQTGAAALHYLPCGLNEQQLPLVERQHPGKRLLLLSIGLEDRKGTVRAIQLLRRIVDADPEFTLTIKADLTRDPVYTATVLREIAELGLETQVRFLLPRRTHEELFTNLSAKHDLLPVYAHADLIISTSKHEGFHYAVGEGMLAGLYPVVYPWEWGDPVQFWGEYVAADADDFVARVLAWGRLSPDEKAQAGKRVRFYAINRFGLQATRLRFLDLFGFAAAPSASKRLVLFAHEHPYKWSPRGGERAMAHFLEHLRAHGYECLVVVRNSKNKVCERTVENGFPHISIAHDLFPSCVAEILDWWRPDVALTQESPTDDAAPACWGKAVPYVIFVHYWNLFNPPPYRDLMTDTIAPEMQRQNLPMFQRAAAIVSNARHVAAVVERFYGVESLVAYTPVLRLPPLAGGEAPRYVTLVTAHKCRGGDLVARLAAQMPEVEFLILFGKDGRHYPPNVTVRPYQSAPYNEFFRDTKVLLFPFDEDPCGTGRVVYEAYFLGIPVVAVGKGGIPEVVPADCLVADNADLDAWEERLRQVLNDYPLQVEAAKAAVARYSCERELEVVRLAVDAAVAGHRQKALTPAPLSTSDLPLDSSYFEMSAVSAENILVTSPDPARWTGIWVSLENDGARVRVVPFGMHSMVFCPLELASAACVREDQTASQRFFSCSLRVESAEDTALVEEGTWMFQLFEYGDSGFLGRRVLCRAQLEAGEPLQCGATLDLRTTAAWLGLGCPAPRGAFFISELRQVVAAT